MSEGASKAQDFFDAIAGRYERAYALPADISRQRMARVIQLLPPAPARVLDLGVGTGRELSALLDAGHAPTGLDVSRAMLDRCMRRARPVPLVHADFWGPLPFAAGAFDAALALHGTLAHPPEPASMARLAQELARVVAQSGVFIAEVPSPAWLDRVAADSSTSDRRVRRTGPRACVYEDLVTGASIEARVLDEAEWRDALAPAWRTHVEPLHAAEWLVVARRT
jgi:SAM-dependent methyltransferase